MTQTVRGLYKVEAAADYLDLGRTQVYSLVATGELRSVKIGRSRRIPAAALEEYIARLEAEQTHPQSAA